MKLKDDQVAAVKAAKEYAKRVVKRCNKVLQQRRDSFGDNPDSEMQTAIKLTSLVDAQLQYALRSQREHTRLKTEKL